MLIEKPNFWRTGSERSINVKLKEEKCQNSSYKSIS